MACQFATSDLLISAATPVPETSSPAPPACFDDNEAVAFWIGMGDGPDTLRFGSFEHIISILFGFVPSPSLPNERLECIRRLTVCLNWGLADQVIAETRRAYRHGVTAETIISLIRSFPGSVTRSSR